MVTRYVIYGEKTNRISEIMLDYLENKAVLTNESGVYNTNNDQINLLLDQDTVHILEQEYIC